MNVPRFGPGQRARLEDMMLTADRSGAGAKLRRLRRNRAAPLCRVAERLGLDTAVVARIEQGEVPLTGGDIAVLAGLFDVPVAAFTEDTAATERACDHSGDSVSHAVQKALRYVDFHRGIRALAS